MKNIFNKNIIFTKNRICLIIFTLTFFGSSLQGNLKTETYYNLQFQKYASAPQAIRIIKIDNLGTKKKSISNGILFTYKNRTAQKVLIAGNFSEWKYQQMLRGINGVWYYFLNKNLAVKKIKYKYIVNNIWIADPKNSEREDDGIGSYVSITYPVAVINNNKNTTYKIINKNIIEFRIYNPGARIISLVGDFNNWNPESDLLKKGDDGIWRLQKRLLKGEYKYIYIIDGKWILDIYNPKSASNKSGNLCSVININ